jgi:hypothetical protein
MKSYLVKIPVLSIFLLLAMVLLLAANQLNYSPVEENEFTGNQQPISQAVNSVPKPYNATLRVYIVEPVSPRNWFYDEVEGQPFDMAFLDFALHKQMTLYQFDSFDTTFTWTAPTIYSDITEDNIMAIAVMFDDTPKQAYGEPPIGAPYIGYFSDAAAGATPIESIPNEARDGFTHSVFIEKITATW